jgi:hypothetical protein
MSLFCNTSAAFYFSGLFTRTSQIKPLPPTLSAEIKIHKENEPIRPVVNNTQAPTYKFAQFLSTKIEQILQLIHSSDLIPHS